MIHLIHEIGYYANDREPLNEDREPVINALFFLAQRHLLSLSQPAVSLDNIQCFRIPKMRRKVVAAKSEVTQVESMVEREAEDEDTQQLSLHSVNSDRKNARIFLTRVKVSTYIT